MVIDARSTARRRGHVADVVNIPTVPGSGFQVPGSGFVFIVRVPRSGFHVQGSMFTIDVQNANDEHEPGTWNVDG
jgi:hypothetical protein